MPTGERESWKAVTYFCMAARMPASAAVDTSAGATRWK